MGIEDPVAGDHIDVAVGIGGGRGAAHPERSLPGIRAAVEDGDLAEVLAS